MRSVEVKQLATDEMYALAIHQSLMLSDRLEVIRVPGGWLYNYFFAGITVTTTFVKEVFFES